MIFSAREGYPFILSYQLDDEGRHETSVEIDPYYTAADYTMSLSDSPIPKIRLNNESAIYFILLKNFYKPRYLLFEGSIYPLPILGVYMKKDHPDDYENAQINSRFNLIRSVTAGFPEPWACSAFIGNVVDFVTSDEEVAGKGYSGFLMSIGKFHIVNNTMVEDFWREYELKLKGTDVNEEHNISWSYSVGTKLHHNSEVKDEFYFSIKRNHVRYTSIRGFLPFQYLYYNSEQDFKINFDLTESYRGKITKYEILYGKNFPFFNGKIVLSIGIGAMKTNSSGYSGELADKIDTRWQPLFRPNISFNF